MKRRFSLNLLKACKQLGCAALALLFFAWPVARAEDAAGPEADAAGAALPCTFTLHEANAGQEWRLSDGDIRTCVRVRRDRTIVAELPEEAKYLYIAWHELPVEPVLRFTDEAGEPVKTVALDGALLYECCEIPAGSRYATLGATEHFAVSGITPYETLPEGLLLPTRTAEQADALLIVTHLGDEAYYFGGLLPLFAGEKDYTVTTVFLSDTGRLAREQAMQGLQLCGAKAQPVFAGFDYRLRPIGTNVAPRIWNEASVTTYIARLIRQYKPEVVITHSAAGEDGDVMHGFTSALVQAGVLLAANGEEMPAVRGELPVFQAARLYRHDPGGEIRLPVDTPLPAFDGLTARELSRKAFDGYEFLRLYHKAALVADTPGYTRAAEYRETERDPFTDLGVDPMPPPSPTPTAEPTPAPTREPEPEVVSPPEGERLFRLGTALRKSQATVMSACGLLAAALVLLVALGRGKKTPLRVALCLLPLVLGALIAFALPAAGDRTEAAILAAATPTPTPKPTPTPTPEPTPEPTPTPEVASPYFRQPGDPAEVVEFDNENGTYAYRSDVLSVEIQRYDIKNNNNKPVRYFVVHLRMRDEKTFRTGFASYHENGRGTADPLLMSRRYKAVVAITGDNMIQTDAKNKGIIIRDGRVFLDNYNRGALVLTPDGMSMYFNPGFTLYAQDLLDIGVENTVSFGPELIVDGVINEHADHHYLAGYNPRVGIGMIEEGHFVLLVVEGRVGKYSRGVKLSEFAQLFYEQGCTQAYNLDGGASSCLLFMGEYINRRMEKHYRNIPDLLMWGYSELVPGMNEKPVNAAFY